MLSFQINLLINFSKNAKIDFITLPITEEILEEITLEPTSADHTSQQAMDVDLDSLIQGRIYDAVNTVQNAESFLALFAFGAAALKQSMQSKASVDVGAESTSTKAELARKARVYLIKIIEDETADTDLIAQAKDLMDYFDLDNYPQHSEWHEVDTDNFNDALVKLDDFKDNIKNRQVSAHGLTAHYNMLGILDAAIAKLALPKSAQESLSAKVEDLRQQLENLSVNKTVSAKRIETLKANIANMSKQVAERITLVQTKVSQQQQEMACLVQDGAAKNIDAEQQDQLTQLDKCLEAIKADISGCVADFANQTARHSIEPKCPTVNRAAIQAFCDRGMLEGQKPGVENSVPSGVPQQAPQINHVPVAALAQR